MSIQNDNNNYSDMYYKVGYIAPKFCGVGVINSPVKPLCVPSRFAAAAEGGSKFHLAEFISSLDTRNLRPVVRCSIHKR